MSLIYGRLDIHIINISVNKLILKLLKYKFISENLDDYIWLYNSRFMSHPEEKKAKNYKIRSLVSEIDGLDSL